MPHTSGDISPACSPQDAHPGIPPREGLLYKVIKPLHVCFRFIFRMAGGLPRVIVVCCQRLVTVRWWSIFFGKTSSKSQRTAQPTSSELTLEEDLRLAGQLLAEIPTWCHEATLRCVLAEPEDNDSVPESQVQGVVNDIQRILTDQVVSGRNVPCEERKRALLRILLRLFQKTRKIPAQIFLSDVQCPDRRLYGMGDGIDVYRGESGKSKVALKHIRIFRMVMPSQRLGLEKTFFYEAIRWFNLSHKNILPFCGLVDVPELGGLCIVSPWVENGDSREYLDHLVKTKGLSGQRFIGVVNGLLHDISFGLKYLHNEEIIHGDLRGIHVYVEATGTALLGDFGLTTVTEKENEYSASVQDGSTPWLAPELLDPEIIDQQSSRVSQQTDVYAFGCLCVELYTRKPPFHGQSNSRIATRVLRGERPERPRGEDEGVGIPDPVWLLAMQCWTSDPNARPTASGIVEAMDHKALRGASVP